MASIGQHTEIKWGITRNGKKFVVKLSRKGFSRTCYLGSADSEATAQAIAINGVAAAQGSMAAYDLLPPVGQKNISEWGEWEVKKDEADQ